MQYIDQVITPEPRKLPKYVVYDTISGGSRPHSASNKQYKFQISNAVSGYQKYQTPLTNYMKRMHKKSQSGGSALHEKNYILGDPVWK